MLTCEDCDFKPHCPLPMDAEHCDEFAPTKDFLAKDKKERFEEVPVTIPEDLWLPLLQIYVKKHFNPASASFLDDATDKNLKKSIFKAIKNEVLVEALIEGIDRLENDRQGKLDLD